MKRFSRRKIALVLACASVLGGKTQAMNKPQSQKTIAAVGEATTKNSSKGFVNWVKNHKLGVGVGGALTAATAVTLTILGVKYLGKKESDGEQPIEGKKNEILKQDQKIDDEVNIGSKNNELKEKLKLSNSNKQNEIIKNLVQEQDNENNNKKNEKFKNPVQNQSDEKIEDDKKEDAPVEIIDKNLAMLKGQKAGREEIAEKFIQKLKDVRGKLTLEKLTSAKVLAKDNREDDNESWFDFKIVDNPDIYTKLLPSNTKIIGKENVENFIKEAVNGTIEKLFSYKYSRSFELPILYQSNNSIVMLFNLGSVDISNDGKTLVLKYNNYSFTFNISKL
jgi:hypothetical protein